MLAPDRDRDPGDRIAGVADRDGRLAFRRLGAERELGEHVRVEEPAVVLPVANRSSGPAEPSHCRNVSPRPDGTLSFCTGSRALAARFERVTKSPSVMSPQATQSRPSGPAQMVALQYAPVASVFEPPP